MHRLSSITSEDLEKRYQEDQSAVVKFTAGQQSYELSFRGNTFQTLEKQLSCATFCNDNNNNIF